MRTPFRLRRWIDAIIEPRDDPAVDAALNMRRTRVPTLWLLGKTGAGKSSIVQRLTGDGRAEIGSGFAPCTRTARVYEHPKVQPVMRFLDTRGLGEVDYDPHLDLAACRADSQALLVIARVDDPDQGDLLEALAQLDSDADELPVLLVHTALHAAASAQDRDRAIKFNSKAITSALGRELPEVAVDFTLHEDGYDDPDFGLADLQAAIVGLVPALADALTKDDACNREQAAFLAQRRRILGYSSAAAALDLVPALGVVSVPSLQGKLLYALATQYDVAWDAKSSREFLAALGTSFVYRYALSFAGRQLGKFIPFYGQTIGAAAAASVSFASTYALGRAACLYLYRRSHHHGVDTAELQRAFRNAFAERRTQTTRQDAH